MTHLPLVDRNVRGVRDYAYEIPLLCAAPGCGVTGRENLEKHELWPRSFLRNQPIEWVRLPDGSTVGNQVYLCSEFQNKHHWLVTNNKVLIYYENGSFYWDDDIVHDRLAYQPPHKRPVSPGLSSPPPGESRTDEHADLKPGQSCPTCNRRVSYPKKADSPAETKPLQFGRAPTDEAESVKEMVRGLAEGPFAEFKYPQYKVVRAALVILSQLDEETVKNIAAEMEAA